MSTLYSNYGELESEAHTRFLTYETERKNTFNKHKLDFIEGGDSATTATTKAEVEVVLLRKKEVVAEREYKASKVSRESLAKILDSMASVINFNNKERNLQER